MKPREIALLLLLSVPAGAKSSKPFALADMVPAPVLTPLVVDPLGAIIRRLPNGLTVYLSPNQGVPRISAYIAVRTGSKNDPAEATGQAHYLEHMLFKGTTKLGTINWIKEAPILERIAELYERRAKSKSAEAKAAIDKQIDLMNAAASAYEVPNEIDRFYTSIGGTGVNAHTSNEETVYVVDIPKNRLEAWAEVESERFRNPIFRLFPTELEAVYEEKNGTLDNANRAMNEELMKRLFKLHPYGTQTTIGTIEHLKNPSLTTMKEFFDRWYVPNNVALVLAGDFDPDQAFDIISRHFGSWTPKPLPPARTWPLPKPKGEEKSEIAFESEEEVVLGWLTVPAADPDAPALEVMDMVMSNAQSGLLDLRLNQAQKVKASGSYPDLRNEAGAWLMWAQPKRGQSLDEAKALLLETLESLRKGDFEESDLAAIITDFEVHEKRRLESNAGRASRMVDSFIARESWERTVGRLDRLRRVTKADVMRVAERYATADRVAVYRRNGKQDIPKIQKPGFTKIDIDPSRSSAYFQYLLSLPADPIAPRWLASGRDYHVLPISGGRLYAASNPYDDLFDLTIDFERGSRQERRLCQALDLLELAGAGPYSADELKKKLYALGTTLSYGCGENESSVRISGLDRNMWPSLELMSQRFQWPNISSGTLSQMVEIEIGSRDDEKKSPGGVYSALNAFGFRGKDSPVLARLSNAELKKLHESELVAVIRDFPRWERRAGYVGPRSPSEIAKLLESFDRFTPSPARRPIRYERPAKTRVLVVHRDMVQARVGLGAADDVYDPARYVDQLFFSEYVGGGMNSLIFQEMREARSLAYHASGGHSVAAHKGDDTSLWGEVSCQADKTEEATELLSKLIRETPISEARFHEAQQSLEQEYRTDPPTFREIPARVMGWEDQGIAGGDPGPARFKKLLAYGPADLASYARRFQSRPLSIWVLGPRDRVGLDALKKLGDVSEKPLDELFPY